MAANSRDVEVRLRVGTAGTESVEELAGDLRDLAKDGQDSGKALAGTAGNADQLAAELAHLAAATREARTAEAAANAEHQRARRALEDNRDALALLRAQYKVSGGDAAKYKADVAALEKSVAEATIALRAKKRELDSAGGAAKAAASAEQSLTQELRRTSAASKDAAGNIAEVGKNTEGAAALIARIGPLLAGAFSAQQFVQIVAQSESLNRSFVQIFGSAARAAEELGFVRETANRLGVENLALAKSYQSLSAATKGTTLEGQATREVFEAVVRSMSTLGKSTPEVERALVAVAQIASKGTASMEELRGQLGEALPGALQAAANGAGLTTEQLIELVSSGKVLASDILPALTKGLNGLYGNAAPPDTIISNWARLKNVVAETATAIGEGGASEGLAKALSGAAIAAQGASAAVDILGSGMGETVAAIVSGNYELGTGEALADKYASALRRSAETAGLAATEQASLATAQRDGTQAAQEAFRAAERLAERHQQAGESMLKVKADYGELAKGSEQYTRQLEKELKARSAEGDALTRLVQLYGTEREQRKAAVQVTEAHAAAARRVADAKNVEAIVAQSLALRLREEALRRGDVSDATRKEVEAAERDAAAKRAEADASSAAAQGKRIEAEAAKANSAAYADNANRLYELRAAASEAAAEVARLVKLQAQGKATADQVAAAQVRAAGAVRLYRDALADASAAAERRIASEQQAGQAVQAATAVDLERARALREVAVANGDAEKAAALARAESALQVRAHALEADAARRVAQAIREAVSRKEEELRATGELTEAKRQELDAQRLSADLKDIEAEKSDILAQKLRALADSEQARTAALEQSIAMQEKAIELAQRQQALEERKRTSFNTAGEAVNMGGQTLMSLIGQLREWGVDDTRAEEIARQFTDSKGDVPYFNNPGQKRWGGDTLSMALQKAAQDAMYGSGRKSTGESMGRNSRTVNINIAGRRSAVNVASPQDGDALVGVLRELEVASRSAAS